MTVQLMLPLEYDGGTTYIYHLDGGLAATSGRRHYTGSTDRDGDVNSLAERDAEHRGKLGARMLERQLEAGGDWHLVATFPGRDAERRLKDGQRTPDFCPDCTEHPSVNLPNPDPVKAAARRERRADRYHAYRQSAAVAESEEQTRTYWAGADRALANLRARQEGALPMPTHSPEYGSGVLFGADVATAMAEHGWEADQISELWAAADEGWPADPDAAMFEAGADDMVREVVGTARQLEADGGAGRVVAEPDALPEDPWLSADALVDEPDLEGERQEPEAG